MLVMCGLASQISHPKQNENDSIYLFFKKQLYVFHIQVYGSL